MTVINHTHGFVFVHIPKNGGTSVTTAVSSLSTWRDLELGGTVLGQATEPEFRRRFGLAKHSPLREIEAVVGADLLSRYRTFAVARDPLARVASTWSFLRRWKDWQTLPRLRPHVEAFQRLETLEAFVRSEFFQTPGPDRILLPQTEWLVREPGGPIAVDAVLRIDHLDEELPRFLRDAGVPPALVDAMALPRDNAAPEPADPDALSPAARDLVVARYRRDFELLGYDPDRAVGR